MFMTPFSSWKTSWLVIILIIALISAKIYEIRLKILQRRRANESFVGAQHPIVPIENPNNRGEGKALPVEISGESLTVSQERAKEGCSICLEEFEKNKNKDGVDNDDVAVLRCDHMFHFHCIVTWTVNKKWCPLCHRAVHRVVVAKMELGFGDGRGGDIESQ